MSCQWLGVPKNLGWIASHRSMAGVKFDEMDASSSSFHRCGGCQVPRYFAGVCCAIAAGTMYWWTIVLLTRGGETGSQRSRCAIFVSSRRVIIATLASSRKAWPLWPIGSIHEDFKRALQTRPWRVLRFSR